MPALAKAGAAARRALELNDSPVGARTILADIAEQEQNRDQAEELFPFALYAGRRVLAFGARRGVGDQLNRVLSLITSRMMDRYPVLVTLLQDMQIFLVIHVEAEAAIGRGHDAYGSSQHGPGAPFQPFPGVAPA